MKEQSLFYCSSQNATPVMAQYFETKAKYPGCLLFFRLGDFYELFFDDAKLVSSILNLALTHRGKHMDADIPMCGVPASTLDTYAARLVKLGYKVAICEQLESPDEAKKRGSKSVVKRDVIRILTAGTIIEDSMLTSKNNFLMSLVPDICKKTNKVKTISFAAIDVSTGDFFVNIINGENLSAALEVYKPSEIIISSIHEKSKFINNINAIISTTITYLPDSKFNSVIEKDRIEKYFKVKALDSFGIRSAGELSACGSIIAYLMITQKSNFTHLPTPKKVNMSNYLIIDSATSKSLELTTSINGDYKGCLLGALDNTKTSFGLRALASIISMPIVNQEKINARLNCIEFFVTNESLTNTAREILSKCSDFERALNRIKFNKYTPKDVGDIRESLKVVQMLRTIFADYDVPTEGEFEFAKLYDFTQQLKFLDKALVEKLPYTLKDGGIIADGYSKELDEIKFIKNNAQDLIANLQARYVAQTGISNLRIKNNGILGWYIEFSLQQKSKILPEFIHRQTLTNVARYTSPELNDLQIKMAESFEQWIALENRLFLEIVEELLLVQEKIMYAIKLMSLLDVYTNFAHIAIARNYVRPQILDTPILDIQDGRHPILELYNNEFVSNCCDLVDLHKICILTGPNMAGKSTYLRQNALLIIMAQIGCYVPASQAKIGIVDRIFSRIGACDDIARGRSTFMVEMIETATILNQATDKSFVILDEVGRGTSTYDGLAIAWAVVEHLYNINKCRVLFATHYRELTVLQDMMKSIKCKTLKVQEWNNEVVFFHKIIDGVADRSYGVHVASIAGIPKNVIKRANVLLKDFEYKHQNGILDLMCDAKQEIEPAKKVYSPLEERLYEIDLESVSPRDALNILYELKQIVQPDK